MPTNRAPKRPMIHCRRVEIFQAFIRTFSLQTKEWRARWSNGCPPVAASRQQLVHSSALVVYELHVRCILVH